MVHRSGRNEVAVRSFPPPVTGPGIEAVMSNNGGTEPRWLRNGRELLYREGDRIMSVTYTANGNAFAADKPRAYLEKAGLQWDVAPAVSP